LVHSLKSLRHLNKPRMVFANNMPGTVPKRRARTMCCRSYDFSSRIQPADARNQRVAVGSAVARERWSQQEEELGCANGLQRPGAETRPLNAALDAR
jgi:hypothetical protein